LCLLVWVHRYLILSHVLKSNFIYPSQISENWSLPILCMKLSSDRFTKPTSDISLSHATTTLLRPPTPSGPAFNKNRTLVMLNNNHMFFFCFEFPRIGFWNHDLWIFYMKSLLGVFDMSKIGDFVLLLKIGDFVIATYYDSLLLNC
jgi:hypothetical protein